jgi:hypothetical protein
MDVLRLKLASQSSAASRVSNSSRHKRGLFACVSCKKKKRRCLNDTPSGWNGDPALLKSCNTCLKQKIKCVYTASPKPLARSLQSIPGASGTASSENDILQASQSQAPSGTVDSSQSPEPDASQSQVELNHDPELDVSLKDALPEIALPTGLLALAEDTQSLFQAFVEGCHEPNENKAERDRGLGDVVGVGMSEMVFHTDASDPVPLDAHNPDFEKWINSFDSVEDFMRQYDSELTIKEAQAEPRP